ncbi:MAG: hypothetical protein LH631_08270, partial [Alkalinema sp. CAN_BIN05]|nr:hypothetical protein [Alkalinema sp. CAN_BIN05]
LKESIPLFTDESVSIVSVVCGTQSINDSKNSYLVLSRFSSWVEVQWKQLDYMRSLFGDRRGGLFVLTPNDAELFQAHAPNFSSWIGSRIYDIRINEENLDEEECEERLAILRQQTGKTDEHIISLAQAGNLPREPEYREWMILFRRGDLVGRQRSLATI